LRKSDGTPVRIIKLARQIVDINPDYLVITGGEPLLQKEEIHLLLVGIKSLYGKEIVVQIETHGGILPSILSNMLISQNPLVDCFVIDYKLPSSKEQKHMLPVPAYSFFGMNTRNVIKFVVSDREDWEYAMEIMWQFECLYVHKDKKMTSDLAQMSKDANRNPNNRIPLFAFSPVMNDDCTFGLGPDNLFRWIVDSPYQLMKGAIVNIQIHKMFNLGKEEEVKYIYAIEFNS
jgi:organic radical activating enzyme